MKLRLTDNETLDRLKDLAAWPGSCAAGMRRRVAAPFEWVTDEYLLPTRREHVVTRLRSHQQQGHVVVIASGTFAPSLQILGDRLGVQHLIGTGIEVRDGRYTGRALPPIIKGADKLAGIQAHLAALGAPIDWAASYAYGDSYSDREFMQLVGHPVAVHPEHHLRAACPGEQMGDTRKQRAPVARLGLYTDLAKWWPLCSSPEEYKEEAGIYRRTLVENSPRRPVSLLELGSGGGNNASHLKRHFQMTLVDLSPGMLRVSRKLNPDCRHVRGDMRTVRLKREFDAVFIHDAIDYMLTLDDLRRAIQTAFVHCRPGGVASNTVPVGRPGSNELPTISFTRDRENRARTSATAGTPRSRGGTPRSRRTPPAEHAPGT